MRHVGLVLCVLTLLAVSALADSPPSRAWQQRIDIEVPLPVPRVAVESANPFASLIDSVPRLLASDPPKKVPVSGQAIAAAYVDAKGECLGAVPLEVPFPGMTGAIVTGVSEGRFDPATSNERTRPSWVVIEMTVEGKVKEATVGSQHLALPDPIDPPEVISRAVPPPAGQLLQLPAAAPEELTSLALPKKLKARTSSSEQEVSAQALVHVTADGRCDRYVPIVLDSGLDRWFSAFLATWRLAPATYQGEPVDAWVVYTARFHMKLSSLEVTVYRAMTDRQFDPN
jgi:hypothetical protein